MSAPSEVCMPGSRNPLWDLGGFPHVETPSFAGRQLESPTSPSPLFKISELATLLYRCRMIARTSIYFNYPSSNSIDSRTPHSTRSLALAPFAIAFSNSQTQLDVASGKLSNTWTRPITRNPQPAQKARQSVGNSDISSHETRSILYKEV
jgi:hypothetical protein